MRRFSVERAAEFRNRMACPGAIFIQKKSILVGNGSYHDGWLGENDHTRRAGRVDHAPAQLTTHST